MDRIAEAYRTDSSSDESSDGDFEFELNCRPRSVLGDFDDETLPRLQPRVFDPEYYDLPPIENITLEDKSIDMKNIQPMGTVLNVIDFVVTIKPNANVPSMDYDTVLFDENAEILGSIFEIFGQISEPMYAIRFNTAKEAQKCHTGMKVMFVPNDHELTHYNFVESLESSRKAFDDGGGQEEDFSDDESERRHFQKQRAKNRGPSQSSRWEASPSPKRFHNNNR